MLQGSVDERRGALDAILASSATASSIDMFLASAAALELGRVEDAGFLLYAAQLRARVDLDRFPPQGQGGDSPAALIGRSACRWDRRSIRLMRDPRAFQSAIDRLHAWDVGTPKGYDPGWDYATAKSATEARAAGEKMKREYLQPVEAMVKLLKMPRTVPGAS